MAMSIVDAFPDDATAIKSVATPGSRAGVNVTAPSSPDEAVAVCVASSFAGGQTLWTPQGGAQA